ncbi:hypothetical protein AVEN_257025-1 [Araneus ventricosus]|uniref:Uncharacterized protein n=1 Tax=Araneus ventricosus TaxID=182803 RepID=A0A4Y2VL92_ARAVE|nr:hypothetical protein AVEN_257025-1 [Araneus ventricosus]
MVTSKLALTCCQLVSHLHSCVKFALHATPYAYAPPTKSFPVQCRSIQDPCLVLKKILQRVPPHRLNSTPASLHISKALTQSCSLFMSSSEASSLQRNSPKYKKSTDRVEDASNLLRTRFIAYQGEVQTRNITLGKELVTAVQDIGSLVSLVREDVSRKIIDRSKLSQNKIVSSGIGGSKLSTKGSFQQAFTVDGDEYCLT